MTDREKASVCNLIFEVSQYCMETKMASFNLSRKKDGMWVFAMPNAQKSWENWDLEKLVNEVFVYMHDNTHKVGKTVVREFI